MNKSVRYAKGFMILNSDGSDDKFVDEIVYDGGYRRKRTCIWDYFNEVEVLAEFRVIPVKIMHYKILSEEDMLYNYEIRRFLERPLIEYR